MTHTTAADALHPSINPRVTVPVSALAVSILVGLGILLLLVSLGLGQILLLAFAGLLLATVLRLAAGLIAGWTGLSHGWSVAVTVATLALLAAGAGWLVVPPLARQVETMVTQLPAAVERLNVQLQQSEWGRAALALVPRMQQSAGSNLLGRVSGIVSTTLDATTSLVVVGFIALFLAANPWLYVRGALLVVPKSRQPRIREVMSSVDHVLKRWIAGQLVTMVVIGLLTGLGLWLIGIPNALLLGVLAAVLNFIPTFGPLIAFVPAALLAAAQGPTSLLYVGGLWLTAQSLEGYVLTPLIQRRAVSLPPVVTLLSQLVFGTLFGAVGVAVAAPLAAALLVIVRMLYVEDTLGNDASAEPEADHRASDRTSASP